MVVHADRVGVSLVHFVRLQEAVEAEYIVAESLQRVAEQSPEARASLTKGNAQIYVVGIGIVGVRPVERRHCFVRPHFDRGRLRPYDVDV